MGLFNKLKKKAESAAAALGNQAGPQAVDTPTPSQDFNEEPAAAAAAIAGPSFQWDGDVYPLPPGWEGLSIEDWFFKFEQIRDRMRYAEEEDLPRMTDEDGDELDPEEVLLIHKYGFQSGGQYEAYRNYAVHQWAQTTGETPTNCEFRMGAIARERLQGSKEESMSGSLGPVEGVDLQTWAGLMAAAANGQDITPRIAAAGMDQAKWDRVSAEWNNRMATDHTATIATAYSNAFAGAGQGQFGGHAAQAGAAGVGGDVGAEPVPFRTFVHVTEALEKGGDPMQVLASFQLTPGDWSSVGMYWNKRLAQDVDTYSALYDQYAAEVR